ncbi:hypothetical protein HYC85_000754 [Camellia sinensis]|uniref:DUF4283 domain-containing protein n=1 Tax=Camellia sinensis TaxID=4442 RepID=A0A7J7I441_CAMSI|nr:hypothetical protein HYC85_000754 [Camellia sinensis]
MDHYLTVRKWELDFKASGAFETTIAIWVQFPKLPRKTTTPSINRPLIKLTEKDVYITDLTCKSGESRLDHGSSADTATSPSFLHLRPPLSTRQIVFSLIIGASDCQRRT